MADWILYVFLSVASLFLISVLICIIYHVVEGFKESKKQPPQIVTGSYNENQNKHSLCIGYSTPNNDGVTITIPKEEFEKLKSGNGFIAKHIVEIRNQNGEELNENNKN